MFTTIAAWLKPAAAVSAAAAPDATRPQMAKNGWPALPGIEMAAGLATADGKAELYRRLLLKFRASQADFAAARRDADPLAAQRSAHTLKGTAGNIGAKALAAAAPLADVLQAPTPVITGLDALPSTDTGSRSIKLASSDAKAMLLSELDRLTLLLAGSDAESIDLAEKLQERAADSVMAQGLRRVSQALSEFDFDAAKESLRELRSMA